MTDGQVEIKPCPFCNDKGYLKLTDFKYWTYYFIRCGNCGCCTQPLDSPNNAKKAWNRRTKCDG